MNQNNIYKPRHKLSFITKSKIWPNKNGYFRHFFTIRGRYLRREQKSFVRAVLVAKTVKWYITRQLRRPFMMASGIRRLRSNKNKMAFGRPVKQRYANRFYSKQQLRFFHGELKNLFFKNFFKRHIKSTVIRSKSFFAELESRADRVFFRRRILPTIFACRQFIYHKGIEINAITQHSPRYIVRTGDIISLAPNVWKAIYDNFFQRIYYRRWGRYVRRRRLANQLKKIRFFIKVRPQTWKKRIKHNSFYKQFLKKKITSLKLKLKKITSIPKKSNVITKNTRTSQSKLIAKRLGNYIKKTKKRGFADSEFSFKKNISQLLEETSSLNYIHFFNEYAPSFFKLFQIPNESTKKESKVFYNMNAIGYQIRLTSFCNIIKKWNHDLKQNQSPERYAKNELFTKKRIHYQNFVFSSSFRKISLPRPFRYSKYNKNKIAGQFFYKRTKMKRFYFKKYIKTIHNKKIVRLKGVHFFIPNYLQIDFRTLRAIKIESPNEKERFYPFRISLPKRYSFYRSKGF